MRGLLAGGWRFGGIVNARSGVPINVTINRPDTLTVGGATIVNVPGGNTPGHAAAGPRSRRRSLSTRRVRWLNPAAFAAPLPGTFGNLPRNFLRGPGFWQVDLMVSKEFAFADPRHAVPGRAVQHHEPPELREPGGGAAGGTVGQPFTDGTAGTFGYMLGPLNRTVGLGTARQTQISLRYLF